jgi:hypothetical protein
MSHNSRSSLLPHMKPPKTSASLLLSWQGPQEPFIILLLIPGPEKRHSLRLLYSLLEPLFSPHYLNLFSFTLLIS